MQFALIEGERSTAIPSASAACQYCGSRMVAKCGPIVAWHWAHAARPKCDNWWENETDWHRNWKARFPVHQQEVIQFAPDGEKHIADIKTSSGLVVELQNSPIALAELRAREAFYGDMIWIVNALRFHTNFHILTTLPPPSSELAANLYIVKPPRFPLDPSERGFRIGNRPMMVKREHVRDLGDGVTMVDLGGVSSANSPHQLRDHNRDAFDEIRELNSPFRFLDWRRPHAAWLEARKAVYFDFGGHSVWRLDRFQETYLCVEQIDTEQLLARLLSGQLS